MAVFRVEKNKGYTVMSNHHLRNKELSLKAKGLLSQMLSLPEDWDYTLAGLSLINRESIDAIRTAVWELEKAGYITRRQGRDEKGKMTAIAYTIYEQPQPPALDCPVLENPTADKPILENPTPDNPTSENPTQLNIESTHPGYDEYRYQLDEINHNPYELTAYLTVLFEDYTRAEVQETLQELFDRQYTLTLEEKVEVRTRTETRTHTVTDPETGETSEEEYEVEVEYNYYILNVTLRNNGLGTAIAASGLTEDQQERYNILLQTQGNRPYLFEDDIYATPTGPYTDYDIPGEALTDEKFVNMIHEAEKYLGFPYVWGGSSPSTSFDCSGFVCWVINNCGNGWNVGRTTANGLMGSCDIIPASEAQPGDLIFFQGTYDTAGASHVGIYVGGGMMIHCGNPISYASIETSYWQSHFYAYGRIR